MQINQQKCLTLEQLTNFISSNNIDDTDKKALISIFNRDDAADGVKDYTLNEENTKVFIEMMKKIFSSLKDNIDSMLSGKPISEDNTTVGKSDDNKANVENFINNLQVDDNVKNALKPDSSFAQLVLDYNTKQKDLEQADNSPMKNGIKMKEYDVEQAKRAIDNYVKVIQNWKDGSKGTLLGDYKNITTAETTTLENGQKAYKCDDGHFYAPSAMQPNIPDESKRIK